MELNELMSAFAEKLGIEGIAVENGTCSLTIDDIPMEFTESPDGLAVVGVAVIGEPPPEKREAFYEMLRCFWRRIRSCTGQRASP